MADMLATLANETGVSPDLAQKGMGAILGFFRDKLPADTFSKIRASIPNADDALAAARDSAPPAAGGILGAISGIGAKLFGSGGTDVVAKFSQLGFTGEQLQAFVPKILEFLKTKVPPDAFKQLGALLPMQEPAAKPRG